MRKQVIIAVAILISAFTYAQKKELRTAEKAIKDNNFAEAKTTLNQVETMFSSMDDKLKSQFYLLKAQTLYANGAGTTDDIDSALENLSKINGEYSAEISDLKQTMFNDLFSKGNDAYENKDYSKSSKYFEYSYRVSSADTIFLYYAASTAVNIQELDRALELYEELRDLGFTGVETEYYAVNVETNEDESFANKNLRDIAIKTKSHINPSERKSESKKPEIVKNIALIYVAKGDNDKGLTAIKEARQENPDDINLLLSEADIQYKLGNKDGFRALLQEATEKDPNNAELQYNLGVISLESDHPEEARAYYDKAIELDPSYINAYINTAALILGEEQEIVEEMNGLGTSAADDKKYEVLRDRREAIYKEAVPYLEKALGVDGNNISAGTTLMNIYSILGETEKHDALKEKVSSMTE